MMRARHETWDSPDSAMDATTHGVGLDEVWEILLVVHRQTVGGSLETLLFQAQGKPKDPEEKALCPGLRGWG